MKSINLAFLLLALTLKAQAAKTISVDGSSTVYPIMEAMAEEYQQSSKEASRVTVGVSGTGGGFKKFCRGETDISNASRPILAAELKTCKESKIEFYELPIAFDAMVIAVNLSNPLKEIKIEDLKKIWSPEAQGKITKWNQVNPSWPEANLKLYGAGSDSGTFDYFTEVIVGKAKSSRGDYTASEDDNVLVKGISGDKGALGYVPLSYYLENKNKLKALAIFNPKGKAVLPSNNSVEDGSYAPLSRPLFIYINKKSAEKPEIVEFVKFIFDHAEALVPQAQSVKLPAKAYKAAYGKFTSKKSGTVFGGHSESNMTIEQLLKKESI